MPYKRKNGYGLMLIGLLCSGLICCLTSCGYQIGTGKPAKMQGVESLYIPMPENMTQYPRLEAKLGNHLVDALIEGGQYASTSFEKADAKLVTKITEVSYGQIRTSRTDGLRPEELSMMVRVSWKVISLKQNGPRVLMSGTERGRTRFFLESNLQTAQQNAFPDALKRVSLQIISSLSYDF